MFELKIGEADSRDLGQLSTYVEVVDEQLRQHDRRDEATSGILLAAARDEIFIQYALRASTSPMVVLTYTTENGLPAAVRPGPPEGTCPPQPTSTASSAASNWIEPTHQTPLGRRRGHLRSVSPPLES